MRTDTETLIEAMKILSRDIESEDGVANAAIYEAAVRLGELVRSSRIWEDGYRALLDERDEAVRSCHIWQDGHSAIVADRDHWRADFERCRDCHHEVIADRDWLILELVEISSTADNCENTWDALAKIGVIADNILNGRSLP